MRARYSVWVSQLYTLATAPAKARRREARANRGGTAYLIALCQIQHLAGACYFLPLPHKPRRIHPMTIYDELKARGLIAQVTDEEEI